MYKEYILLADKNKHKIEKVVEYEGMIFQNFEQLNNKLQNQDFEVWATEDLFDALKYQKNLDMDMDKFWAGYVYVVDET